MAKIASNRLLIISFLMLCLYWVTASIVPHPYLSISNNTFLFMASSVGLWRYRKTVTDILFREERSEDDRGYGGYLAVYGIFLVFLGSFYGALYSSIWIYYGQPLDWIGTSYAQFGRFLTICGFGCMAFSPDITREGFILPDRLWAIIIAMLLVLCAGIWIGTKVESSEFKVVNVAHNMPVCRSDEPIVGTRSKKYHPPDSRYVRLVVPHRCFATETDAKAAGYAMVK